MTTPCPVEDTHVLSATDPEEIHENFREVLAHFGSGVVVITSIGPTGRPVGMTVGSFTSISMEPPLVGFFAGHSSSTLPHVVGAGDFCVNVLAEDQHELAANFARSGTDKFANVRWVSAAAGTPRLTGAHAWIECALDSVDTYGDHDLVVGRVRALTVPSRNAPLLFHRSGFHGIRAL